MSPAIASSSVLQEALANGGGFTFHSLAPEAEES